jgi:DNA repair protein RecO (recombination protein O)
MLTKTEAIVLHAIKYSDSRIIVEMFTRETGRLSFMVPIAKTSHGRMKKQYFQPMTLLEVTFDYRQRSQLQYLKDVRPLTAWSTIPFTPEKLALTLFVSEFLYHALHSEQQNEALFSYVCNSMQWLDMAQGNYANFHLTFLMRMSRFLGFYPNLSPTTPTNDKEGEMFFDLREGCFTTMAPTHHDFLQPNDASRILVLMRMDFPTMHLYQLSRHDRNRITEVLLGYYRLHIPQFPELKSLNVLQELWA